LAAFCVFLVRLAFRLVSAADPKHATIELPAEKGGFKAGAKICPGIKCESHAVRRRLAVSRLVLLCKIAASISLQVGEPLFELLSAMGGHNRDTTWKIIRRAVFYAAKRVRLDEVCRLSPQVAVRHN
jgi:hypothetical protein